MNKSLLLFIDDFSTENMAFLGNIYRYGNDNDIKNYYLYLIDFFKYYGTEKDTYIAKLYNFIEFIAGFNINTNILMDLNESRYCDYSEYKKIEKEKPNIKIFFSNIINLKITNKDLFVISGLECFSYDEDDIYDWDENGVYYFEKDVLKSGKDSNKIIITRDKELLKVRFHKFLEDYSCDKFSPIYLEPFQKNKSEVGVLLLISKDNEVNKYSLNIENEMFNISS